VKGEGEGARTGEAVAVASSAHSSLGADVSISFAVYGHKKELKRQPHAKGLMPYYLVSVQVTYVNEVIRCKDAVLESLELSSCTQGEAMVARLQS
jgi:hypothetical protein